MFPARLRQPLNFAASSVVFVFSLIIFTLFSPNALYARDYYPIQTKLQTPSQATSQATSGITLPVAGSVVSGTVMISGTATTENFAKYELHYKPVASDDDGYIYFSGASVPVIENQLSLWETTNLPNGTYMLRLRVVDEVGNYAEYTTPEITVSQNITRPMSMVTPDVAEPQASIASPSGAATGVVTATTPQASVPLTVTITGSNDPAQVEAFLRYLLAGYTSQSGYITATIGALPADLLLDLPLPEEAVVVGGYVRDGEYVENQLLIAATGSLDDLVETIWQSFRAQGFRAPVDGAGHGSGQVFLPQNPVLPDALCNPDGDLMIYHSRAAVQDAPPVLRLNIAPVPALFGPCSSAPNNAGPAYGILPQLLPPPGAQVQGSGGGGGSNMVAAEAEIHTSLSATELAAHYSAQLEAAGWEALDDSAADAIAWSTWRFYDEQENAWTATFYIVQLGDSPDDFIATLRADAQR